MPFKVHTTINRRPDKWNEVSHTAIHYRECICIYIYTYIFIYIDIYIYLYIAEMQKRKRPILFRRIGLFLFCISAINALYFVHRAPYGGEDSTLYVIYLYIYIYIYIYINTVG